LKNPFLVVLILFISLNMNADWIDIPENSNKDLFEHSSSGKELTTINFSLDGYTMELIRQNEEEYQQITYWNEGEILEIGKPDLPCFSRLVAIPNEGSPELDIITFEQEVISNVTIFPQQELQSESNQQRADFTKKIEFYNSGDIFPTKKVRLGEIAIMRDFRLVTVTFNPFQYDPISKELIITKNIEIEIRTSGTSKENIKRKDRKISRTFESLYKATILNYNTITNREEIYQDPCYLFIYVDDLLTKETLNHLIDWKCQKGYEVHAQAFASGTSSTIIKNYIQEAYDNWENPPEYVCLVGDADGSYLIPASNGIGDHGYTQLDGNDILSDVFLGRLSYNTILELQTIIFKILHYEKEPYLEQTDWYRRAVVVGDPTPSGTSTIDTKMHVRDMILQYESGFNVSEIYNGAFSQGMVNELNAGVSYFNYRGYYGMSGFGNYHILNLNNGYMLPVAVFLTCDTGTFVGSTSRSEQFIRAGSPQQPKGAIAAIGTATSSTHTCFNNCIDAGIYYGIFSDHIFHMGGALNRGKLNLYLNYPQNPASGVTNFSYWNNLMGDPGMDIWTNVPKGLFATYENLLPLGSNNIEVYVSDEQNRPVENAWVTFWSEDVGFTYSGYSNEDGEVVLAIDVQEVCEGLITVTKHDFKPIQGSCEFVESSGFVNIHDYIIDDDNMGGSSGNANGIINPGEVIELKIDLMNYGSSSVLGVNADLSTINEDITITDETENYGDIAANTHLYSSDDFDFIIDTSFLGESEINFILRITDDTNNVWFDYITLPVEGAVLYEAGYDFPGNANNILEPGEESEFAVILDNLGSTNILGVYGILSSSSYDIIISDDYGYFGDITAGAQGQNLNDTFTLTASADIIPGSLIPLSLQLYTIDGYDDTINFDILVGVVSVTDPLGPDSYGYYCYDDEDISNSTNCDYNWIEINNVGTVIPLNDYGNTGDVEVVDLPFVLTFYGEEYDAITVCSNGWLSPGVTEITSFMNWTLPGALGPSPMIAPFWDDLRTPEGDVYYYHHSDLNCFIIEWENMQNEYNQDPETFQVLIYETSTSLELLNNEIKFQYKIFNNVDQGAYPSNHGQYATVGIEDHTGTRGLEYTFNNNYPSSCKTLEDESAIFFTGGPNVIFNEPFVILEGVNLIDENMNSQADYAETVDLQLRLMNLWAYSATNVTASISSNDPYITIAQDFSNFNDIASLGIELNQIFYSIDVSEACPDQHLAPISITVNSDEGSWELEYILELHAPNIEFYSYFIDDDDNYVLDPGETTDVQFSFVNNGSSDAFDLITEFSENDPMITISNVISTIENLLPENIETCIFTISVDENAPVCYEFIMSWEMNGDFNYNASGSQGMIVFYIPVNLQETFSGDFPPEGWYQEGVGANWNQAQTNVAGGDIPEASMHFYPAFVGEQSLITMPINTLGSTFLELEFKQFLNDLYSTGSYQISVLTSSDGLNWNPIWQQTPTSNVGPETLNLIITNPDVGSETFQLAFKFLGNSSELSYWRIDDVILTNTSAQQVGFLEGNVSLLGGAGSLDDVIISAGNFIATIDENGFYHLSLPVGTYQLIASLPGYENGIFDDVLISVGEITTVVFELSYMEAPQNLDAAVSTNNVMLTWIMPTENDRSEKKQNSNISLESNAKTNSSDSSRSLCGYKIYRNENVIYQIVNPDMLQYSDENLLLENYDYYVTAVYGDNQESEHSNHVSVDLTDTGEIILPTQTELYSNYPNPFNPTTTIAFSIAEDVQNIELEIYNLKGQKVKQLLSNQLSAGKHTVVWNGEDESGRKVSSGIYFYKFIAGDFQATHKMLLMK
jgi:Peptidase family C25/Propeptide_C25/FlgD Ig-like domain